MGEGKSRSYALPTQLTTGWPVLFGSPNVLRRSRIVNARALTRGWKEFCSGTRIIFFPPIVNNVRKTIACALLGRPKCADGDHAASKQLLMRTFQDLHAVSKTE